MRQGALPGGPVSLLEVDPDLDSIREGSQFKEMLAATKQRLGMKTAAE